MLLVQMSSIFIAEALYNVTLPLNFFLCFSLTVFPQVQSSLNSLSPPIEKNKF